MSKKHKAHPPHQSPNANLNQPNRKENERHVDGNIWVKGEIEAHLPPDAVKENNAEHARDDARENKKLLVEVCTLIAVIVYASITFWQAWLTRTAIKDARVHFTLDERPYVWRSGLKIDELKPNQRFFAHIFFINYGKSPALHRRGRGKIFLGPTALEDADKWFDSLPTNRTYREESGGETVDPPGMPPDPEKYANYTSVFADRLPTDDDIKAMRNVDQWMVVVERDQYFDLSGNFYSTDMCWFSLTSGPMAGCCHHNEIR